MTDPGQSDIQRQARIDAKREEMEDSAAERIDARAGQSVSDDKIQAGGSDRKPGFYHAHAEPLETAGLVAVRISSGVADFDILLDVEQAIDLHRAIAHAARTVSEAAA